MPRRNLKTQAIPGKSKTVQFAEILGPSKPLKSTVQSAGKSSNPKSKSTSEEEKKTYSSETTYKSEKLSRLAGSKAIDEDEELTIEDLEELLQLLKQKLAKNPNDKNIEKRIATVEAKLTYETNRQVLKNKNKDLTKKLEEAEDKNFKDQYGLSKKDFNKFEAFINKVDEKCEEFYEESFQNMLENNDPRLYKVLQDQSFDNYEFGSLKIKDKFGMFSLYRRDIREDDLSDDDVQTAFEFQKKINLSRDKETYDQLKDFLNKNPTKEYERLINAGRIKKDQVASSSKSSVQKSSESNNKSSNVIRQVVSKSLKSFGGSSVSKTAVDDQMLSKQKSLLQSLKKRAAANPNDTSVETKIAKLEAEITDETNRQMLTYKNKKLEIDLLEKQIGTSQEEFNTLQQFIQTIDQISQQKFNKNLAQMISENNPKIYEIIAEKYGKRIKEYAEENEQPNNLEFYFDLDIGDADPEFDFPNKVQDQLKLKRIIGALGLPTDNKFRDQFFNFITKDVSEYQKSSESSSKSVVKSNSSIQSNPVLSASQGQISQSIKTMSAPSVYFSEPNQSVASNDSRAIEEQRFALGLIEADNLAQQQNISGINSSMNRKKVSLNKSQILSMSKRSLQISQESSFMQNNPANNGMNLDRSVVSRLSKQSADANSQIIPSNNSIRSFVNNGVIPQDPNPLAHDYDIRKTMIEVSQRMVRFARNTGMPEQMIQRMEQLPQRLMQAQQVAQVHADQAEQIMELQEENKQQLQSRGNNAAELASVNNTNDIIEVRSGQEEFKRHSINSLVFSESWNDQLQNLVQSFNAKYNLNSEQSQLLVNSLSGENFLLNAVASSSAQANQSLGGASAVRLRPNLGVSEDEEIRRQLIGVFGRQLGGSSQSAQSSRGRGRRRAGSSVSDQSSIQFGDASIENYVLGGIDDLELPFSASNQNPEANPFNNWVNAINRNNNNPVNQSQPFMPNKIVLPKPEITVGDMAKFVSQAFKFVSDISGPISNVILSTYKKQTSVYKGKVEKKESTNFKVKPGAMFRVRAC